MSQEKSNDSPKTGEGKKTGRDKNQSSLHQDSTKPVSAADTDESLPEIDEGPRPGPVDEIQAALFEAAKADMPTDLDFDQLASPGLDLDEGPRATPVDEVQEALFKAAQEGVPTEIDFDTLPEPSTPTTQKVVKFDKIAPAPEKTAAPTPPPEPAPASPPEPQPQPRPRAKADLAPPVSEFWPLMALFVVFRLLTLLLLQPGGFIRDWSDFDTYFGIASLSDYGLYPFLNFWLEWPPLVPWLMVGGYRLSLLLPPWPDDPRLWFVLILGSAFVLFEIGNFALIYRLARRLLLAPETINRVLWIYAGLFPPVYAMLGFFDGVALFFILLALDLLLEERRFASAMAVGVGFMVKIIPALLLPVAARKLWHQYRENNRNVGIEIGIYAVAFGLTVMLLLAPFIFWPALNGNPQWWPASFRSILGRSSWETVWAVAEGYYGFGQVGGNRLNPAETNFAVHHGWPSIVWWAISLAFAAIYAFIFTRKADYDRPPNVIAFAALTVSVFMLYSKGYSPQFLVYLLPFILLLLPNWRGLAYMLALTGLNVLEQPVYFVLVPNAAWLLLFIVIARFLITLMLAAEFALVLWPQQGWLAPFAQARQRIPVALGGLAALALLVLTPLTIRAYHLHQIQNSPVQAFAGFMESQLQNLPPDASPPRLLLSDQSTYRQIYPHLRRRYNLQLTDGSSKNLTAAATIPELLQAADRVWILPTGPQARPLTNTVANRGAELASYNFEGLGTVSLYTLQPNPQRVIAPARFLGGIELLSHQVDVHSDSIDVTLYWRARNPQNQNLTAFTQIINAEGQRVAGHDSIPRSGHAPVTGWTVDAVVADPHRIELPPDLPAGEYTLIAGLYNDFNERVQTVDPQGIAHPNRAVVLANLRLE